MARALAVRLAAGPTRAYAATNALWRLQAESWSILPAKSLESNTEVNLVADFARRRFDIPLPVQSQLLAEEQVLACHSTLPPQAEPDEPEGIQAIDRE